MSKPRRVKIPKPRPPASSLPGWRFFRSRVDHDTFIVFCGNGQYSNTMISPRARNSLSGGTHAPHYNWADLPSIPRDYSNDWVLAPCGTMATNTVTGRTDSGYVELSDAELEALPSEHGWTAAEIRMHKHPSSLL